MKRKRKAVTRRRKSDWPLPGQRIMEYGGYKAVVEKAADFIYVIDKKNTVLSVNESATKLLGKSLREIEGKSIFDLFPKEVALRFSEHLGEVFRTGNGRFDADLRMALEGKELWISTRLDPIMATGGGVSAVLGVTRDITKRKGTEVKLLSLHKHASQLNTATNMEEVARCTLDALESALGFNEAHFLSVENDSLQLRETRGRPAAFSKLPLNGRGLTVKAANTKTSLRVSDTRREPAYVDPKGYDWAGTPTVLSELVVPVFTGNEAVAVLDVQRDQANAFTEEDQLLVETLATSVASCLARLKNEEALRESEHRYGSLFERMLDGVYLSTHEGRFVDVNPAFVKMFGYSSKEEMLAISEIKKELYFSPQERGSHILDTGREEVEVYRMRRKDGSEIWVEDHGRYVHDSKGNVIFHEGILRDVTERVRAEMAQKQMEEELRRRAHELHSLQETLLEITDPHDLPKLLNKIVERAATLLGAPGGGLYICNPDRQEVRCVVAHNTIVSSIGIVLKYGEGAAGVVAQTGKPLIINDYRTWPSRAAVYEKEKPFGAVLSAPMIWQGRVVGVIHVLRYDTKQFTERDLELLTMFANHAAIAVENARLYEQLDEHASQMEKIVKERTAKLAESEARYRRLFESSPISLWEEDFSEVKRYFDDLSRRGITDVRRYLIDHPEDLAKCSTMVKILDVNETTLDLYGAKTVEELKGELSKVFTDEFRDNFTEELATLAEGKTRYASEFDNRTLTGETKHVSLILNVVPGYEDTLAKVLASVIDLTERKAMEQRLQQAERLAAVGETAAMVGHDLRNPLQGIAAAIHLLKHESLTARERDDMLDVIEKSLEYSDAIIRDLSDYSAEIQLKLEEATPKSILRAAMGTVKIPQNLSIQDLSEDQPTLRVDADKLRRVFTNLIENAIDAMPQGGTLTLTSKRSEDTVEISCSDTGSGVADKVMDNLWKPLHTTKAKGLGLGLPICKRIVDTHGGKISVKSKAGEGTTVTIRLPIKPEAEVRQK